MYETFEPQPVQPKRKGKVALVVVGIVAALGVGYGVGNAGTEPTVTAQPKPEVVTKTVTETKEVPVEVVPEVCLTALSEADRLSEAASFLMSWSQRYMGAVADLDYVTMLNLNDEMSQSNDSGEFNGVFPMYEEAATQCRMSGS